MTVVGVIRILAGLIFVAYGIFCGVVGLQRAGGCLLAVINAVIAPMLTVVLFQIFPVLWEEVSAMDSSGNVLLGIVGFCFLTPGLLGLFEWERIPGILNGLGFCFLGMIISGVVADAIILGGVGIIVQVVAWVFFPAVLLMVFIYFVCC